MKAKWLLCSCAKKKRGEILYFSPLVVLLLMRAARISLRSGQEGEGQMEMGRKKKAYPLRHRSRGLIRKSRERERERALKDIHRLPLCCPFEEEDNLALEQATTRYIRPCFCPRL